MLLQINNWLVQRAMKREAVRIADWAAKTYPVVKAKYPECAEPEVLVRMLFDDLSDVTDSVRLKLHQRLQSIEGLCYTVAMDLGALQGFMVLRCLQFTRYMDDELYARGFEPQSREVKERVLGALDLLVEGWEHIAKEPNSRGYERSSVCHTH